MKIQASPLNETARSAIEKVCKLHICISIECVSHVILRRVAT